MSRLLLLLPANSTLYYETQEIAGNQMYLSQTQKTIETDVFLRDKF